MKNLTGLKKFLDNEIGILDIASQYYYCLEKISKIENEDERNSDSIRFLEITSWDIVVIELCKLLHVHNKNNNQSFSFQNLFKSLINNYTLLIKDYKNQYSNSDDTEFITKAEIDNLKSQLNENKLKELILQLDILRDKFYVHTDTNRFGELSKIAIRLIDLEYLIRFSEKILFDLKQKIFHTKFEFNKEHGSVNVLIDFYLLGFRTYTKEIMEDYKMKIDKR